MSAQAFLVAGLGFGDEGKGATVDYLVRKHKAAVAVRFNGGAQAAHNVVAPDGSHHTFQQFGSGTLANQTATYLSRFVAVNPLNMRKEAEALFQLGIRNPYERMYIDESALVTTPYHVAANRLREWMRSKRHGSCGLGVGETFEDFRLFGDYAIRVSDLLKPKVLARKLAALRMRKLMSLGSDVMLAEKTHLVGCLELLTTSDKMANLIADYMNFARRVQIVGPEKLRDLSFGGPMVFEGAQGVLLDAKYGFYPHVTKSNTTFANAEKILEDICFQGSVSKIGVLRSYATRHGAGPFVTEDASLKKSLPEPHNAAGQWQGKFRVGWFDAVSAKYAGEIIGPLDEIALTFADRLSELPKLQICTSYTDCELKLGLAEEERINQTQKLFQTKAIYEDVGGIKRYLQRLQEICPAPIGTIGLGPKSCDRKEISGLS
ncbi:MAG: adenylosuccinate synthetase [Candidatus Doudnabacteria bacterium]|nr:adenylosuccinate synthetase [Candidatus Doudnabacteria bacterium]